MPLAKRWSLVASERHAKGRWMIDVDPPTITPRRGLVPATATGIAAIGAGVLVFVSARLAGSTAVGEPGAIESRFGASSLSLLVGYGLLLAALVGIWSYQQRDVAGAGLLGHAGAAAAAAGTLLAFGATWANLFVSPWLVDVAPSVAGNEASGSLRVGLLVSYGVFAGGWALFALASIRAGVLNRFTSVLLLLLSILSFFPSRVDPENTVKLPAELHHPVPLAVIVAVIGFQILRRSPSGKRAANVG